ncbi:hypothetical protein [Segatella copri]|uniref:Leucine-rich repeat domain-containing protein n=1 Tax=Segatella copri TaxID=165179 RepID=A0A3E5E260_9BACT|nr:hypothetical protein [Segatella copri]RGN83060.1 hypothetical protein DXB41_07885 [Segatella copri]RGS17993.1 hypothetical protein DWY11_04215 [Segatella copri]
MGKCLITKLNGVVDNELLPKLYEIRIEITSVSNPSNLTQGLSFNFASPVDLKIIGDGYFTDETLTENLGKVKSNVSNNIDIFVSNGDYLLSISNKTQITTLQASNKNIHGSIESNKKFDINNLKYSKQLFHVSGENVIGDISAFKGKSNLNYISLNNTRVTGDISALSNLTKLKSAFFNNTGITGDISALANLTALKIITAGNTGLYGNLGSLPDNMLSFTPNPICTGKFYWTNSTRKYILACSVKTDDADGILVAMSKLEAKFGGEESWWKTITLYGNRTAASDAAVQTLQSKGYTVSITPA